ncbi:MAG: alpha/beta hydrolase [Dehalococcoidia bacterium]
MKQPRHEGDITLADGRTIAYAEFGDPYGMPTFYFHGWPGSRREGALYDDAARRHAVRLIALDRPGYGRSTFKRRRTLEQWADDVAQVATALQIERFAVAGLSGGGPYALACALSMPGRLVATLVISGEPPQVTKRAPWHRKALAWWSHHTRFFVRGYFAFVARGVRRNPRLTMALAARSIVFSKRDRALWKRRDLREGFAENLRHAFAQGTRALDEDLRLYTQPWGFELEDVRARVHWWHGEDDRIVPMRHVRQEIVALPDVISSFYPGEGHFMVLDHVDEILRVIAGLQAPPNAPPRTPSP